MIYQQDWLMRQIEAMIQAVLAVALGISANEQTATQIEDSSYGKMLEKMIDDGDICAAEDLFKVSDDRVFIIDEIDRCLHPSMTVKVIELFLSMAKKRNTQLIITSHESRLLASEMLRNDEICFVCKTAQGKSIINPLEKYQLRADKKVYAALFDGTLDAGPSFDEEKLSRLSE